jgi:hypothetical protein
MNRTEEREGESRDENEVEEREIGRGGGMERCGPVEGGKV